MTWIKLFAKSYLLYLFDYISPYLEKEFEYGAATNIPPVHIRYISVLRKGKAA